MEADQLTTPRESCTMSKSKSKSVESKTGSASDPKLKAQQKQKLLEDYDVAYTRKGQPYLVLRNATKHESTPTKDVVIAVGAATAILASSYYLYNYQTPDYTEIAQQPAAFNFTTKQKEFYEDAYMHVVFLIISCLFLPTIFKLRAIMRNRPAFELRGILFVWNMIASLLSGWGMYYVVPELLDQVQKFGLNNMLCQADYCWSQSSIGIYVFVYQATKCLEWIDTALLALRKKPLNFLHLFHHIVTMVYCWHAAMYSCNVDCSGVWYAGMNLVVHFIMYMYYGIMALNIKVVNNTLRKFSFMITILQTSQMVMGIYVLVATAVGCEYTWQKNWHGVLFCAGMYGTYLYLFGKLTIEKFAICTRSAKKTQ